MIYASCNGAKKYLHARPHARSGTGGKNVYIMMMAVVPLVSCVSLEKGNDGRSIEKSQEMGRLERIIKQANRNDRRGIIGKGREIN